MPNLMMRNPIFEFIGSIKTNVDFYGNLTLSDTKTSAILIAGWSFSGWENKTHNPVQVSLVAENPFGKMEIVTSKYITNPTINGTGSVVVYDFNGDGKDDIFLPAHNESPLISTASTVFLTRADGTFSSVTLPDSTMSHSGLLGTLDGKPTVVTSGYGSNDPYYQFNQQKNSFDINYWGKTYSGSLYGSTANTADLDGDGKAELLIGDFKTGPGYPYDPSKPNKFVIYKIQNGSLEPRPAYISDLRFDSPKYEKQSLISDFNGLSHNTRLWLTDFNQDEKPDVLLNVGVWTSGAAGWQRNQIQMLQNDGKLLFSDVTDQLNNAYDEHSSFVDYSMQLLDLDNSGIASYLLAGDLWAETSRHSNYLLLNDGTGKLYRGLHEQFSEWSLNNGFSNPGKYIPYLNQNKKIDYLLQQKDGRLFNLELDYNPSQDFTENVVITNRNDSKNIRTWAGNDSISDTGANSTSTKINGGLGIDTAIYSGKYATYSLVRSEGQNTTVRKKAIEGIDTLTNIERLKFSDISIALDLDGNAGKVAKVLGAVFNKTALTNKEYVGIGLDLIDGGMGYQDLAALAVSVTKKTTSTDICTLLWTNVFGEAPTTADIAPFKQMLDSGEISVGALTTLAADTSYNTINIDLVGLSQTGLEYV